jgi:hypothetical protein
MSTLASPVERLAPSVFRLPVERLRDGWYSDAYFNLTKELLESEHRRPRVMMQVFRKHDTVLGGIDEAIAILRECSGRRRKDSSWEEGWEFAAQNKRVATTAHTVLNFQRRSARAARQIAIWHDRGCRHASLPASRLIGTEAAVRPDQSQTTTHQRDCSRDPFRCPGTGLKF